MSCIIRKMDLQEIEIAIYLAYKEGWNPGLNDGFAFYYTDPDGFFIAEIDNKVVGCISAVKYSDDFGFIGFNIVDSEYQNSNAEEMLTFEAMKYLNCRNIGIDCNSKNMLKFTRLDFKPSYENIRYEGIGGDYFTHENIKPLNEIDFDELVNYDSYCFPSSRPNFLKNWINVPKSYGCAFYDNGIKGYGIIRPCKKGFKIGPLFADSIKIANEIFKALSRFATDELIYIDAPQINPLASELAEKYDMKIKMKTTRMYKDEEPLIDINKIFGITTFELG